jgi:hypothetical protein
MGFQHEKWLVSALLVLVCSGIGLCRDVKVELDCLAVGECVDSPHVAGQVVEDDQQCLQLCKGNALFQVTKTRVDYFIGKIHHTSFNFVGVILFQF